MATEASRTDTVGKMSLRKENGKWVLTIPFEFVGVQRYEFYTYEAAIETVKMLVEDYVQS